MTNIPPVAVALTGDTAGLDAALKQAEAKVAATGAKMESLGGHTLSAESAMKRLESNLAGVAIAATGADPHISQIATTIGAMSIEGPVLVGVLAGLAAVAIAYEKIGGAARDAAEKHEKLMDKYLDAAKVRALGPFGEQIQARSEAFAEAQKLVSERARINQQLAQGDIQEAGGPAAAKIRIAQIDEDLRNLKLTYDEAGTQIGEITDKLKDKGKESVDTLTGLYNILNALPPLPSAEEILAKGDAANLQDFYKRNGVGQRRSLFDQSQPDATLGRTPRDFGSRLRAVTDGLDAEVRKRAATVHAAAEGFDQAGQVVVASFGAMAEAAVTKSNQMAAAITGAIQAVVANIKTSSGGLFGSTLAGSLVGVGIGIIGSLFGRHHDPAPVKVSNADEIARQMAEQMKNQPIHIRNTFITPGGQTIEETEVVLRNREARDAVPRYTGRY